MKFSFPIIAICAVTFAVAGCKKKSNMNEHKMSSSSPTMSETGSQAGPMNYTFIANLSGSHEVPSPVKSNASGKAYFKVNSDSSEIFYTVHLANADSVIMAHIHYATSSSNGPILVWLYPEGAHKPLLKAGPINGTLQKGVITSSSLNGPLKGKNILDLIHAMEHDSAYVQVHTKMYPSGEIRGQVQMK